jgi:superfamily II RNA helicase
LSATRGNPSFFSEQLTTLTGVPTTLLQEKVTEFNQQRHSPVYLVHFTQKACADTARDLLSTNFCTKEEKHAIARRKLNTFKQRIAASTNQGRVSSL